MRDRPRVALIVEMSGIYGRGMLQGIAQYVLSHRPWSIFLERPELRTANPGWLIGEQPPWLLNKHWDGVICRSTDRRLAEMFRDRNISLVDTNDRHGDLGAPRIWCDNRAIGRLGAEHLLKRGFRHFAFYALSDEAWALERGDGFVETVRDAGHECSVYESPWRGRHVPEWDEDQDKIARSIQSLPKPLGLMASNDQRGQHVLDACRRAEIAVPEDVAVIGVENDKVFCELCDPPLSSVEPDARRVGYEAAELLDRLMAGDAPPVEERLIAPLGVVTRQSTDVLGVDNPDVAGAMRYIREHACGGAKVADVVGHVLLSRSALERQFRKYLGHSPQEEIRLVQLKRVKQLLGETDLSLEAIAKLVGYKHPEYMNVVFKRLTGQTPGEFRQASRGQ